MKCVMCEANIEDTEITTTQPNGEMCQLCSEDMGSSPLFRELTLPMHKEEKSEPRPEDEGKDKLLERAYDKMKKDQENKCKGCDWWEMSLMAKGIDSWGACNSPQHPGMHHLRYYETRYRIENKKRIKELIIAFHPPAPYYGKTTWWNEFCDDKFKAK